MVFGFLEMHCPQGLIMDYYAQVLTMDTSLRKILLYVE